MASAAPAAPTRCAIDMRALGVDLLRAAAKGNVPKLREALVALNAADGIDVNVKNKWGYAALIRAAKNNHKECVQLLLAADGINVNVQNKYGDTALILAAWKNNKECVQLLLAVDGIDVNVQKKYSGDTVLHVAADAGHADVCTLLLTACAAVDALASHGKTALHKAALYGHAAAAAALLRGGASLRVEDGWGSTAVQLAAASGFAECVEVLQCEARWRRRRALARVREQRRVARDHWKRR